MGLCLCLVFIYVIPKGIVYLPRRILAYRMKNLTALSRAMLVISLPSKPFFGTSTESSQTEQAEDTDKSLDYILEFLIDDDEIRIAPPFDINNIQDETSE